ncbi:hypothetical protein [Amycolatopsis kentuckyensis]|uniref:hypothetical protein n=1 Tax=Amycolatopsis kentuckyensis TaxID=218823 RepID=UPI003567392A
MTGPVAAHRAAVKALLEPLMTTIPGYPGGQVSAEPEFPYWVLFLGTGTDDDTKLSGDPDELTLRFQVNSVGLTDDSAVTVVDKTRALLLGARPVVAGWSCHRIRRVPTDVPLQADTDVTLPDANLHPMYAVDIYELVSRKD